MKKSLRKIAALTVCAAALGAFVSCGNGQETASEAGNAAIQNILSRKSVRSFTDQKLTEDQFNTLLKAAMAAPTGMNAQPWSFVVLQDTSRYDEIFAGNMRASLYKKAPAVIVFCGDTTMTRKSRETGEEMTMPNMFWSQDVAASVENFLLAAESMGLGAVWTACYPDRGLVNAVKAGLGLPDTVLPFCVVPVGYPAGDDQPKDKWKPEKIHYEKW